jgi:23S rRNA pseudouridine1911/1915/1917 synthase
MLMEPKIIYQDESILVLDKPSGWVVNEALTAKGNILQNWLKENFEYPLSENAKLRSGIVHRLDKETSGVMLVAKTEFAFKALQKQFKERGVEKTYLALVHGVPPRSSGEIIASVGRLPWNRERFGVLVGGREAATEYRVISNYQATCAGRSACRTGSSAISNEKFSMVEFYPKSGRTHQIRIHAKYIGHPVVSDSFYAGRKTSRKDRLWCKRLFLHASEIVLTHPKSLKKLKFKAPLPSELKLVLKKLS